MERSAELQGLDKRDFLPIPLEFNVSVAAAVCFVDVLVLGVS